MIANDIKYFHNMLQGYDKHSFYNKFKINRNQIFSNRIGKYFHQNSTYFVSVICNTERKREREREREREI